MRRLFLAIGLMILGGTAAAQERQVVQVPGALTGLPFSPAIRVGNLLFLSGQIGNLPGTRQLISGGIAAETRQALENIRRVLEAAGSNLGRVVKCTVFLADIADYAAMNEVYAAPRPGSWRGAAPSNYLGPGGRLERDCVRRGGRA